MKRLIFITGLIIAFTACKNKDEQVSSVKFPPPVVQADAELKSPSYGYNAKTSADIAMDAPADDNETDGGSNEHPTSVRDTSKKIIKTGDIEFETEDILATRHKILASLKRLGGYVEDDDETTNGEENRKQYELKVSIPAKNFDLLLDTVSSAADKIDSKNISITDVTTKFIDVKTRLANKQILEKRYLELLNRSSKVSDLLEIENKLTEIRSDIESTQGQLNYLSKQVAYSSLDITFYTKQSAQVNSGDGAGYKFKKALADGWQILQNLFFGLIGLWPIIIIVAVIYWLIKRWRKRRRARKSNS